MRLSGNRLLDKGMSSKVQAHVETRDAILWEVLPAQRMCQVKIQGSNKKIPAWYNENWEVTPKWLKPGNAVRISHTGGLRNRIEIVGHGALVPTPVAGGDAAPAVETANDAVLTGCNIIQCPNDPQMAVLIKIGTYRISGSELTLGAIAMADGANFKMSMGGQIGTIAGAVVIDAAPGTGYFRFDLIALGGNGVIDVVKGSNFSITESVPSLPADHVELGRILLFAGMTEITQADIGRTWSAPLASQVVMTIADDDLAWAELTTTVTVSVLDQFGNAILAGGYGWYITLEIIIGNGTVTSAEEGDSPTKVGQHTGAATHEYAFTYTRDQDPGDESPTLEAVIETTYQITTWGRIILRDDVGDPM